MNASHPNLLESIAKGAVAGLAGTAAMIVTRTLSDKFAPRSIAPAVEDPGRFIVHAAERTTGTTGVLPPPAEKSAIVATHLCYGASFGALYGLLRGNPRNSCAVTDGTLLGLAVYAAGYLGWLPAVGLTRPVWKEDFAAIAGEITRHVAYGVATTAAYDAIS